MNTMQGPVFSCKYPLLKELICSLLNGLIFLKHFYLFQSTLKLIVVSPTQQSRKLVLRANCSILHGSHDPEAFQATFSV